MMNKKRFDRVEAQKALLDLLATATGLPIGLYEIQDNGQVTGIFSERSLANFEEHCRLIQSFKGGKALCQADQCNRAHIALHSHDEQLTLCHAGLYNQALPIKADGETRAVLLYGEMQIAGDQYQKAALEKHRQAVEKLNLTNDEADRLRKALLFVKARTPDQLHDLKTLLSKVEQSLYSLIDDDRQLDRNVRYITHELHIRITPVIAKIENLSLELSSLRIDEVRNQVDDVLNSALGLFTLLQTLGDFLKDYQFVNQAIAPLLGEAARMYKEEAAQRGIEIDCRIRDALAELEISRPHLQHAINNLVHNAIKYSFRGTQNRRRWVKIECSRAGNYYQIVIENYGVGVLPEEIQSRVIFQDGYQGKLREAEYRSGIGKGLYYVDRVIKRHHGSIKVESELMSDSEGGDVNPHLHPHLNRFTVSLPFHQPRKT